MAWPAAAGAMGLRRAVPAGLDGAPAGLDRGRFVVVGLGQAGVVAICAAGLLEDRVAGRGHRLARHVYHRRGLRPRHAHGAAGARHCSSGRHPSAGGLDVPRDAWSIAEGVTPQAKKLPQKELHEAFVFTRAIYKLYKAEAKLMITEASRAEEWIGGW